MGAGDAQPGTSRQPPVVSLTPPAGGWAGLVRARAGENAAYPQAQQFRRELGLPTDRPVVMSGHQAQWWHAGILAKQIALAAVCKQADAAGAWVVVDQDASESASLTYPVLAQGGALPTRGVWAVAPDAVAAQLRADVALGDLPAFAPSPPPVNPATADIARGQRAIADSASRWAHAANAAEQIARANAELVAAATGEVQSATLVFAAAILRTTAGRALLEKMAEDPGACVAAYNKAVRRSGVRTIAPLSLVPEKSRYELPLWQLSGKGNRPAPRRRVFSSTLSDTPLDTLAPRGILMSALLRWLGCDLFIHGLGGGATGEEGGYDKVGEIWMRLWLGVELAPSVTATATVLLPMGAELSRSESDLRTAYRNIEDARHAPRTLGDASAQAEKDALVARIAGTTDRVERLKLYRELQRHLEAYRSAHAAGLKSASDAAALTERELTAQSVLRERTWPWPLLPRTMVLELQRRVRAQFEQ